MAARVALIQQIITWSHTKAVACFFVVIKLNTHFNLLFKNNFPLSFQLVCCTKLPYQNHIKSSIALHLQVPSSWGCREYTNILWVLSLLPAILHLKGACTGLWWCHWQDPLSTIHMYFKSLGKTLGRWKGIFNRIAAQGMWSNVGQGAIKENFLVIFQISRQPLTSHPSLFGFVYWKELMFFSVKRRFQEKPTA